MEKTNKQFLKLNHEFLFNNDLNFGEKILLAMIANDDFFQQGKFTQKQIATKLNVSERQLRRMLHSLEERKYISIILNSDNHRCTYTVNENVDSTPQPKPEPIIIEQPIIRQIEEKQPSGGLKLTRIQMECSLREKRLTIHAEKVFGKSDIYDHLNTTDKINKFAQTIKNENTRISKHG